MYIKQGSLSSPAVFGLTASAFGTGIFTGLHMLLRLSMRLLLPARLLHVLLLHLLLLHMLLHLRLLIMRLGVIIIHSGIRMIWGVSGVRMIVL